MQLAKQEEKNWTIWVIKKIIHSKVNHKTNERKKSLMKIGKKALKTGLNLNKDLPQRKRLMNMLDKTK